MTEPASNGNCIVAKATDDYDDVYNDDDCAAAAAAAARKVYTRQLPSKTPAAAARQTRFTRRRSVAAEQYDPEEDDEDEDGGGTRGAVTVHPKTDEQRTRIRDSLAPIFIFRSLEPDQMNDVIDAMFERRVIGGDDVIRQGDDGDNFYVIESGVYDVIVSGGDDDVETEPRTVHRFEERGSFGELALMYNVPRSATVTAVTSGTLWAMDRKSFRRIVVRSACRKRKRYEALLETVPMLRSLDPYERMNLADALTSAVFRDGDRIIRQGAEADGMYFVEEGEVRIVVASARDASGTETEVARMKTGDYFGEMALVEDLPRSASVFAVGTAKVAFLERSSFERLLGPCIDVMKRNIDVYRKMNP